MSDITEKNNKQDLEIAKLNEKYNNFSKDIKQINETLKEQHLTLNNHMNDFREELKHFRGEISKIKVRIAYATGAISIVFIIFEIILKKYL